MAIVEFLTLSMARIRFSFPLAIAVGFASLDATGWLRYNLVLSSEFVRMLIYGSLLACTYINFRACNVKTEIEIDGFVIKEFGKVAAQNPASVSGAAISDSVVVSPLVAVSTWPPVSVLGWTPFKSLPFNRPASPASPHFWSKGDSSIFQVRSVGYKTSKMKEPSAQCLYECIGVDLVKSDTLFTKVVSRLPKEMPYPWSNTDSKWTSSLGVPRLIVINMQLPYSAPSLWAAQSAETDPGFSLVSYYVINPTLIDALNKGTTPPAIKLLRELIIAGKSTKEGLALKAIGMAENIDELGFPDLIRGYNGKPVLVTKSASIGGTNEIFEIEFDVRMWSILARKSLHSLKSKLKEAVCQVGMLIEGRSDDEFPEQLLGCYKISYLDIAQAIHI